jgi:hypothetical protein
MNDVAGSRRKLAEILDRLVEEASGETPASFAALATQAGFDPARDFVGASLREIDLRGEDLRGFDFSKADLVGADLRGANLEGVSFSGAETTGCLGLPHELLVRSDSERKPSANPNRFQAFFSFAYNDLATDPQLLAMLTVELEKRVTARLVNKDFTIWADYSALRSGVQWNSAIEDAIRASDVLIILLTPRWIMSDYCRKEYLFFESFKAADGKIPSMIPIGSRSLDMQKDQLNVEQQLIYKSLSERQYFRLLPNDYVLPNASGRKRLVEGIADDIVGILERARNTDSAATPPPDFDLDKVRRMILAGVAPPSSWVPFIHELIFQNEPLADLSPLAGLSGLRLLFLNDTPVSDISPLSGLSGLRLLDLGGTKVSDVSPLSTLNGLQYLHFSGTPVGDVSPLKMLVNLRELDLTNTPANDLSPLAGISGLRITGKGLRGGLLPRAGKKVSQRKRQRRSQTA